MSFALNTDQKGGFVHGIPQVSTLPVFSTASGGCCGSTDQTSDTGCCGEPVTQVSATAKTQETLGCCGEPAAVETTIAQTGGCCGEPATTPVEIASAVQSGCCN